MYWGPHSWSWRAAGCAGVLSPGPGEQQGVLGSSLLVLESRRVYWGPPSWSSRAVGCAGVLPPGPGEPEVVLGSPGPGVRTACRVVVKVLDLDPQGWWFDPWCGHNKTAVGPLSKALNPTLLQGICLLLSLINCTLLWIKASAK